MDTHHENSPIDMHETLMQSVEVGVSQSVMTRTRLGIGIKRGIGSVKKKMISLRRRSIFDEGKGRMVLSKASRRSVYETDMLRDVTDVVDINIAEMAQTESRERPRTARGKRREVEESGLEDSEKGGTESRSPATQRRSWWEREVDDYSGSEVEPFEFPWSSPPVGGGDTSMAADVEEEIGSIYTQEHEALDGEDESQRYHRGERASQSNAGTQVLRKIGLGKEIDGSKHLVVSETGTQIHHSFGSPDIFESTAWEGPLDRSFSIDFDQNVRPRVLPYLQEPNRIKIAALPQEVRVLFRTLVGFYNDNRLTSAFSTNQLQAVRSGSDMFEIVHHSSVLSMALLLPDCKECPLSRRILQELLSLDVDAPPCHRDNEIYVNLRSRAGLLLAEVLGWLERLERLRTQLIRVMDDGDLEKQDLRRLNEHRRWARRVGDEVLILGCAIEVRLGEVGGNLRGEMLGVGQKGKGIAVDEETDVDCEECRARRVDVRDRENASHENMFSQEQLIVILDNLRNDDS